MRISDGSSDVCSSDLVAADARDVGEGDEQGLPRPPHGDQPAPFLERQILTIALPLRQRPVFAAVEGAAVGDVMDVPVHIAVDRVELRPARVVQDDRTAGLRRLAALRGEALAELAEARGQIGSAACRERGCTYW